MYCSYLRRITTLAAMMPTTTNSATGIPTATPVKYYVHWYSEKVLY